MMKLRTVSQLPVDPQTAWSLFESEDFRARLESDTGIAGTIVEQSKVGEVEVTHLRYATKTELPRMAAKIMGTSHLSYEQENRFDPGASQLAWVVRIPALGERLQVSGVTTIKPTASGCERTVDGTINVNVRVIGGQIEKLVAGGFGKSMDRAVDVIRAMISERGLG